MIKFLNKILIIPVITLKKFTIYSQLFSTFYMIIHNFTLDLHSSQVSITLFLSPNSYVF